MFVLFVLISAKNVRFIYNTGLDSSFWAKFAEIFTVEGFNKVR